MIHKEELIQLLQNKIEVGFENAIQIALQNFDSDDEIMQGILINSIISKCYKIHKESVVDIQKQISINIPLEELIAIVENISDEKRSKYLNEPKTTLDLKKLTNINIDIMSKNAVENFIKNNFEIFRKLKNKQKIEMHEFFDLSRFLELEKTQKPMLGIDLENNVNMDMVILGGALNEMENKAKFFFKRAIPFIEVDKKIILKIIDFGLKLEDYDYTPHFYELSSDCKKELNLYNEALKDIDTAIQLISEVDWKKEDYYDDYISKKSEIENLLDSTEIVCISLEYKDENIEMSVHPDTYLIDQKTNTKLKLKNTKGISIFPKYSQMINGAFTLYFNKLPTACKSFSLVEEDPEGDGMLIENIRRTDSVFYKIEI